MSGLPIAGMPACGGKFPPPKTPLTLSSVKPKRTSNKVFFIIWKPRPAERGL